MLSIVLARQNIRENDQIITLYTLESGKVEVLARGAKKILSKNSAYLEPGGLVNAEIISGKEFSHLGSVEPVDVLSLARKNFINITLLGWSVGLVRDLIQANDQDHNIFKLLFSWLRFLNTTIIENNALLLADIFAVKLFQLLGFDITHDEHIEKAIKADFETIMADSWAKIYKLKLTPKNGDTLHKIILKFVSYHSETKLQNWVILDKLK